MQRDGQLNDAEIRPEMSAGLRENLDEGLRAPPARVAEGPLRPAP